MNPEPRETVPKSLKPVYDQIVGMTNAFCEQHLDGDYARLCMKMAASLARKRPSPLTRGQTRTWVGAIIYALGRVNFLFDSTQRPHLKAAELCSLLGVSLKTASSKARLIEDILKIGPFDPRWCVPKMLEMNPLASIMSVNGFLIDARQELE